MTLFLQVKYSMVGNSVSPPLARALGRCIAIAASSGSPQPPVLGKEAVDPYWSWAHETSAAHGLKSRFRVLKEEGRGRHPPAAR